MIAISQDFITAREASNSLSKVLDRAQITPQVITRGGKPAAVVVDPATFDDMQRALEMEAESLRIIADAAAERVKRGDGIPAEVFLEKLTAWGAAQGLKVVDLETADPAEYLDLD